MKMTRKEKKKQDKPKISTQFKQKLKNYGERVIKKCSNCSYCRNECPTYLVRNQESYFAGGRMRILRTFVEREFPLDADFVEVMYFCTTCKQCEDICPINLDYVDIIEDLRAELVRIGVGPYGKLIGYARNINKHKNPFGEEKSTRIDWITPDVNRVETGPYAYFVGCTASFRKKELAQHTASLLTKMLGEIVILGSGEYCCGSPLIRTGQINFELDLGDGTSTHFNVKDLISHNIESMLMKNVREVIYSCSGCYKTSVDDWERIYGKPIPLKFTHLSQFLARRFKNGTLKVENNEPLTITYHDPCHLGRHAGVYDAPREIIKNIPNYNFIEMKKNRNRSLCCGAGAGVKGAYPTDALAIAKLRVQEAIDTGADMLLTSCVFCKLNFLDAVKAMDASIVIKNTEDIMYEFLQKGQFLFEN